MQVPFWYFGPKLLASTFAKMCNRSVRNYSGQQALLHQFQLSKPLVLQVQFFKKHYQNSGNCIPPKFSKVSTTATLLFSPSLELVVNYRDNFTNTTGLHFISLLNNSWIFVWNRNYRQIPQARQAQVAQTMQTSRSKQNLENSLTLKSHFRTCLSQTDSFPLEHIFCNFVIKDTCQTKNKIFF